MMWISLSAGWGGHYIDQKGNKPLGGVTGGGLCQPPGRCAHRGRRRRESAVTVIFEAVAFGTAGRERQDRVEPVQGLNGALFIDEENSRVHWRVEVD